MAICKLRTCKKKFTPKYSSLQRACSPECAWKLVEQDKADKAKKEKTAWRVEKKKRKEALMTLGDWKKRLQERYFNKYILLRDKGQPCISCGRLTGCKMNAGHFLSVGSHPELRFNEDNVHIQCEHCNSYLSGNQIEYEKRLREKIGNKRVDNLKSKHEMPQYRVDDIKGMIEIYKNKIKEMR